MRRFPKNWVVLSDVLKTKISIHSKMKNRIPFNTGRTIIISIFTLLFSSSFTNAQDYMPIRAFEDEGSILAISPLFYKGLKYGKGEFDFNVLHGYAETNPEGVVGIRLNSYLNLSIRDEEPVKVKNGGVGISLPIYPYRSDFEKKFTHHFYIAPGFMFLISLKDWDPQGELSLFGEPGYSLRFSNGTGLNFGVQAGKTLDFNLDRTGWSNFLAIRISYLWVFY